MAHTHVVRRLDERWVTELRGVRVVRPELLALQFFDVCRPERAELLADRLWSRRLLSGRSIKELLDDLGERGRNGTAGLRAYFEPRGVDYVPPASGLEGRAMRLLGEAGIPLRRQVDSGRERWTGRVDFRHEYLPVIVEVQSEAHHTALVDVVADGIRIAQLVDDGFSVVEITDDDLWLRPRTAVQRVEHAVLERVAGRSAAHFNRLSD